MSRDLELVRLGDLWPLLAARGHLVGPVRGYPLARCTPLYLRLEEWVQDLEHLVHPLLERGRGGGIVG